MVDRLSNLFLILLKVNTAEDILVNIILSLRHFLFENKSTLFRSQGNMFCTDCLCELFQKCFGDSFKVTVHSISLVYAFFKANFIEVGEILHMKWSATLALSKLDTKYYPRFLFVLEVLLSFAKKDPLQSMISSDWFLHIHDILSRLYRIVQYTIELPETNDPEYKTELFINLSQECHHSVEMRLKWYSALASFHEQSGYWEEAGQCKVFMASLIASYLIKKADTDTSYLPQSSDSCKQVSPNIIWELPLSEKSIFEPVSSLYFHENGYMNTVHSAIDAMVKASMFEEGVELVSILFDLHRVTGKFKKLEELGKMLWELADRAEKAITSNTRLHYNYYRVCMYGPKFKKFNNTKWIYKELPSVRLVDFSERLVKQFTEKFGEDVKVLPNTHDDLQIEPDKHYLQMLAVSPFLDANRLKSKKTLSVWDKQHGINSFAVEAPWGGPNGGKPSDEVSKQWKIRTIYFTPQYFPGYQRRLRVTEEKKDNIGPLECAIDLIESRLELIKVELHISPPNTKTLQIVLQGSIMPQVNSGPKAIMHYFLTTRDGQDSFDQKKIAILKEKLVEFIRLCDFALRLNEKLIDETQKEYQKVLQEHFNQFRTEAASYLQI
uniref:DOCKER domain-containing protein n=1 Tax=Arcella intermedia TaxID=1963864 RepID=A0A6B2KZU6_9EUKA